MKKDVCFKLGEECCHYDPMMKCNVKMTVEKCGNNKFMACCKYDNGMCAMVCATVNCNFMIRVSVDYTKFLQKKSITAETNWYCRKYASKDWTVLQLFRFLKDVVDLWTTVNLVMIIDNLQRYYLFD